MFDRFACMQYDLSGRGLFAFIMSGQSKASVGKRIQPHAFFILNRVVGNAARKTLAGFALVRS